MITVQVMSSGARKQDETLQDCLNTVKQLESYYNGRVSISLESRAYGCSVIIRNNALADNNAFHRSTDVINTSQAVVN